MKRITDKGFDYTPSHETDIGKRFKRIWSEQRAVARAKAEQERRDQAEAQEKTIIFKAAHGR